MFGFALIGALIIALAISFFWLRPSRVVCPACKSAKVSKIHEEVEKLIQYDTGSSGMGGGGQLYQIHIKETYRCRQCEHMWVVKRTEA